MQILYSSYYAVLKLYNIYNTYLLNVNRKDKVLNGDKTDFAEKHFTPCQ